METIIATIAILVIVAFFLTVGWIVAVDDRIPLDWGKLALWCAAPALFGLGHGPKGFLVVFAILYAPFVAVLVPATAIRFLRSPHRQPR
jgi:hypothetical protein